MKKIENFENRIFFDPISKIDFDKLSDGFYIVKAHEEIPIDDDNPVESDYYLFEMNDEYRGDTESSESIKKYHQLNIKKLSEEEYVEYMNSDY